MNSYIEKIETINGYVNGDIKREKISFFVRETYPTIANYIKVSVRGGLMGVKCLDCEIEDIDSNDIRLLRKEFIDFRVKQIPIMQDINIEEKFELNISNTSSSYMDVDSDKIKPNGFFMRNLPITRLSPYSYIRVKIKVIEDTAINNNPCFTNCSTFNYDCVDYIPIQYLSKNGTMHTKFVYYSDIGAKDIFHFHGKRILVIDPQYDKDLNAYNEKYYDYIHNELPKFYNGQDSNPEHFYLSFETFGTIDPYKMMKLSIKAIADRLISLQDSIKKEDTFKVSIIPDDYFIIIIKQELIHTAELIFEYIGNMAPDINITYNTPIYSNTEFTMKIYHTEGKDILLTAINDLAIIFNKLSDSF